MSFIKIFIKFLFSKIVTLKILERFSQNLIWRNILLKKKPKIVSSISGNSKKTSVDSWNKVLRHKVWDKIPEHINVSKDILYLEFGVWKGHSIKYFADKYKSPSSEFYGFDTFYGFPEKCLDMEKGHYSTSGEMPQINDVRIKFIKGLFQETLPIFLKKIKFESKDKTVLIHFDAPLHSATLFNLFKLSEKFTNYYFIFDQLGTEECRALNNFNKSTLTDYDLYFASLWNHAPEVVFGKFKT